MFRPTSARLASQALPRLALRQQPVVLRQVGQQQRQALRLRSKTQIRTFADAAGPTPPPPATPPPSGSGGGISTNVLLGVFAVIAIAAGGYYYVSVKPAVDTVNKLTQVDVGGVKAKDVLSAAAKGDAETLKSIAQAALPPSAFAMYEKVAASGGDFSGFLNNLKDGDFKSVVAEVKKVGGEDVKRVIEKIEKKVSEAKGNVSQVDWKGLAVELKKELPKDKQSMVDMLIGQIPSGADIEGLIKNVKQMGEKQLKEVEATAAKILQQVEKARKDGKGQADAFLKGLKDAAPDDIDKLIKQLKDAAKSAGLPADTAEAWLKAKVQDGKVDVEAMGKQVEDQIRATAKYIPGNPKDFIDQVAQFSPSVAKLLAQAMQQVGVVDEKLNRKV